MQKAFELLYQMVANLENYCAQYNLGLLYEDGNGIIKSIEQAIYWLDKDFIVLKLNWKNSHKNNKFNSLFSRYCSYSIFFTIVINFMYFMSDKW
jgi:hypothetical protein